MRHVFRWKFVFHTLILPTLRRLGAENADRALGFLGRFVARSLPGRVRYMAAALQAGSEILDASWPVDSLVPRLAADTARFQARDYALEGLDDDAFFSRFDVRGSHRLMGSIKSGRGAILVGCHFGAHLSAVHWLYRRGIPLSLLAQRPNHVSPTLERYFDAASRNPQTDLFLQRGIRPIDAAQHLLVARDAIRRGSAVYLNGDIPWDGPNTRTGTILGQQHRLLITWIELALLTGSPVFWVFCTHEDGGRFALDIEPVETIARGEENLVLDRYLAELNARIANDPTEAVAHLLWPCYSPASIRVRSEDDSRPDWPSRRKPAPRSAKVKA